MTTKTVGTSAAAVQQEVPGAPTAPPAWGMARTVVWGSLAVLAVVWFGPLFLSALRPSDGGHGDFTQEWLSAKNVRAGLPVYAPQAETYPLHMGREPEMPEHLLAWNAHPPVTVLLGLPSAWLGYADAHLVWNLLSLLMLGAAVVLVIRELGVPFRPLSVLPLVALTMLCHPLYNHLSHGQLNALLALLVVLAWAADRHGRTGWAGGLLGAAAAIKLFPAFLFLYFVCTRRWRAVLAGAAVFVALNALAAGALGLDAYRDYVRVVVPSVAAKYQTFWLNVSLAGFWLRVFAPDPRHAEPLVHAPLLGTLIANGLRLAAALAAARACWRARTVEARDRALGVTLVAMLLVSPLSWNHGYLMLVLPLGLLWMRLPAGRPRWALRAVLVVMWAPELAVPFLTLGTARVYEVIGPTRAPITAEEHLLAVAVPHYALVGFFLLALRAPAGRPADR